MQPTPSQPAQPFDPSQPCDPAQAKDELVQKLTVLSSWLARELSRSATCLNDPMSGKDTIYFRVSDPADVANAESLLKRLGASEPARKNFPGELVYRGTPIFVVSQPGLSLHGATLPPRP